VTGCGFTVKPSSDPTQLKKIIKKVIGPDYGSTVKPKPVTLSCDLADCD
jgi:hypothetical protein